MSGHLRLPVLMVYAAACSSTLPARAAILPPSTTANFYVSNYNADSVAVYDSSGAYLRSITHGDISGTNCVAFDADGTLLDVITHPDLTGPQGIAFDDRGHMFSSSFYQHNVVEFDADGNYVQTITGGNLSIPRSVAFIPGAPADLNQDGLVDAADVALLLGNWGPCPPQAACPADLNGDTAVDAADLALLLGSWSGQ